MLSGAGAEVNRKGNALNMDATMELNENTADNIGVPEKPQGDIASVAEENKASARSVAKAAAVKAANGVSKEGGSGRKGTAGGDDHPTMADDILTVQGFKFSTLADAKTAEEEYKKMVYIRQRMNMNNPEEILAIYDKMIENGLFVTPVGVDFLMRVREYLTENGAIDSSRIRPIETGSLFTQRARNEARAAARPRVTTDLVEENRKLKNRYHIALATAIISVILVAAMFIVAKSSDNPNIINYRNAIENQYAEWEENLTQREQAVREKEEALKNGQD